MPDIWSDIPFLATEVLRQVAEDYRRTFRSLQSPSELSFMLMTYLLEPIP